MELKDYWLTVRRRWKLILTTVAVCVGLAAVLTWQTTPQYSSSTRLFVSTSPSDTADAYQGGLFATQRIASYAALIKDRPLAEKVAEDLGGNLDPDELTKSVSARVDPETVILEVTATNPEPSLARDIAQAYAQQVKLLVARLETPDGKSTPLVTASITSNAQIPQSPISPQPLRNLALALVLGLLLGVGIAVMRELLDTSVSSADDVETVTEAPILGHINADQSAVKQEPAVALGANSPWAEAFRVLRTNMQYVEVDHDQKVFVVTSSLPSEGKSTTAVNLAITLAMANQRVALVECDLRRPLIAARLGLDGAVGTTSILIGKVSLADALQRYGDTGLSVLACGPIPPNPSELLQSQAMEKLLSELRDDFDVVILDAPPLLPVTDAALLSAQADGALVVVRHGRTTRDQLSHAIERLEAVDAKALGIVINLAPSKRTGKSYGYGYGYGYGYETPATKADAERPAKGRRAQTKPGKRSQER